MTNLIVQGLKDAGGTVDGTIFRFRMDGYGAYKTENELYGALANLFADLAEGKGLPNNVGIFFTNFNANPAMVES